MSSARAPACVLTKATRSARSASVPVDAIATMSTCCAAIVSSFSPPPPPPTRRGGLHRGRDVTGVGKQSTDFGDVFGQPSHPFAGAGKRQAGGDEFLFDVTGA